MEVCVFFLRSIRRRLVTGFLVALGFMCIMTIAALWALQQHQIALSEIEFLAHKSPDKAQLLEKVNMILHPLLDAAKAVKERRTDLSREEIIFGLQNRYIKNVRAAQAEAKEFWERSEKINNDRGPGFSPQTKILQGNMEAVTRHLMALEVFEKEISSFATTAIDHRERQLHVTNYNFHAVLAEITFHLQRLPAYEKENYVLAKLRAKTAKSSLWQRRVWILAAISLVSYAITIFCGFQWISNPLRTIAHGASRIANGDTRFRTNSSTWSRTSTAWQIAFRNPKMT
jgi:hypothetical protein